MQTKESRFSSLISALFGIAAVTLVAMIVAFPAESFSASLSGLRIWWEYVFPALLPFFILSELMLGLGVIHAVGVLLEPLMRLLFRLPGAGGWAAAMGFTIGFPAGAKAAADLRRQGFISRSDGNRLLALSHLCSPVFLTIVVAASFWGKPEFGLPLFILHLLSALLTGLIVRVFFIPPAKRTDANESGAPADGADETDLRAGRKRKRPPILYRMFDGMQKGQRQDGRVFGRLLGEAVGSSVQSLLAIGGFMIVFSVLLKLLAVSGLTAQLHRLLQTLFVPFGVPPELAEGAITALFEVHLGAYALSHSQSGALWTAALLCAAVGWGGLSVHAQVKSLIAGTDLRYAAFLLSRIVHSIVSLFVALTLWEPLRRLLLLLPGQAEQTFSPISAIGGTEAAVQGGASYWQHVPVTFALLALVLAAAASLSLLARIFVPKRFFDLRRN
ncbi:nucleoside recognition domain-containing protein [Paenibacillus thermotolerans]|uniref:nucleoside recognition domain-containing protein n=1 Tax=Paenibacillus thermotolerans TaxID=3027807 RepID=UPI0023684B14|nr:MULTISPECIES: nucleoside recognition domain-containing protein [unclassified Paenibacillus]